MKKFNRQSFLTAMQMPFEDIERGSFTPDDLRRIHLAQTLKRLHNMRMEGISLYRALPHLEGFHACRVKWAILDGSNRSGKSKAAAAESCRAWQGVDPYDKYPRMNGNSLVVGQELDDIARLWRTCSEPSFKRIRDERTGLWRAVRPDPHNPKVLDPYDDAYREKWRDAPPLLAPRMVSSIAWENKSKRIPRVVVFVNGWKVLFRSSSGNPPQGDHYHHVLFDEQLEDDGFYSEANRGLTQLASDGVYSPRGNWSATSQTVNIQLDELRRDAEAGVSYVRAFKANIDDNPFITEAGKREFYESLSDDEREVRYYGKNAILTKMIYGIYEPMGIHGCEPFAIPPNWCRFLAVDPGTDHCATTFYAIDPQNEHVYLYDAIDLRGAYSDDWAHEVKKRQGDNRFESWVMDQQMGKQRTANGNDTPAVRFFQAAKNKEIKPRVIGPMDGFFPGSNDVQARTDALLEMLNIRGTGPFQGTPRLQIFRGVSPELDKQFKRACNDPKNPNKRFKHKNHPSDLLETVEYMAAFNPQYHEPERVRNKEVFTVFDALKRKEQKQRQRARRRERDRITAY